MATTFVITAKNVTFGRLAFGVFRRPTGIVRILSRWQSTTAAAEAPTTDDIVPPPRSIKKIDDKNKKPPPTRVTAKIPVKHSRRQLPRACKDLFELKDLTAQLMETPLGSLYSYDVANDNSREAAWASADVTVQMAEYVVRGYSYHVHNTIWNRWHRNDGSKILPADEALKAMEIVADRLWEEGHSYMQVRANRMEELAAAQQIDDEDNEGVDLDQVVAEEEGEDEKDDDFARMMKLMNSQNDEKESQDSATEEDIAVEEETHNVDEAALDQFMNEFALPGPTVSIYDTILDAMAVTAGAGNVATPQNATHVLESIVSRHVLDDDENGVNTNFHTRPTVLSFNAAIRTAANQEVDENDAKLRDESLELALNAFSALTDSTAVQRNTASYLYLLQTMDKCLPDSIIKGNIANGMLQHARYQCLLNDNLIQTFVNIAQKQPAEGGKHRYEETLRLLQAYLENPKTAEGFQTKWKRLSKKRRHHSREDTY